MPTGLWHGRGGGGRERGEVEWDSTSVSRRRHEIRWNEWIATRLDSTREILVDERRGAGAVRLDVWGSLAGCFSKIRARRGRGREGSSGTREKEKMENSGEKSEGGEGNKLRAGRSLSRVHRSGGRSNFRSLSGQPRDRLFLHPFSLHADETLSFLPRRIVR